MATLLEQYERSKKLTPQKISKDVFNFIKRIENELIAYNVATLRDDSQDIFGKPIGFYSKATELISGKTGAFDLLDTGKLLDSVFVKIQSDSIFFGNSDPKLKEVLKNTLSDDLFGLQDEDLQKIIQVRILPHLQGCIRKGLGI